MGLVRKTARTMLRADGSPPQENIFRTYPSKMPHILNAGLGLEPDVLPREQLVWKAARATRVQSPYLKPSEEKYIASLLPRMIREDHRHPNH